MNELHSFKDYTNQSLTHLSSDEFSNTTIKGTCFYQEIPEDEATRPVDVFPAGTVGVTFENCNLDNVKLPANSNLIGRSSRKLIKKQDDGFDWEWDENTKKPIRPMEYKKFVNDGRSVDPASLPGGGK